MICNLIIQIDQNCAEAYRIKVLSLIGLKYYAEAIITCELMNRFNPLIPDAYINKGLALYKLGRYNEVIVTNGASFTKKTQQCSFCQDQRRDALDETRSTAH